VIARLTGTVDTSLDGQVVLDVRGVGYLVQVDLRTFAALESGTETTLHVHTQVREDAIQLFGFQSVEDRTVFEKLLTVNKVGPKVALGVLGGLDAADLVRAIDSEDVAGLTRIKGVGAVMARRMVMELKGKLSGAVAFKPAQTPRAASAQDQFSLALARLGYKRSEIMVAMVGLKAQGLDQAPLPERLSAALRILSRTE